MPPLAIDKKLVHEGLKVQVDVAHTTLKRMLVSVEVAKVIEGEWVAVPPAMIVDEAIVPLSVLPDQAKLVPAVILPDGVV